jgi:hypothetical protein
MYLVRLILMSLLWCVAAHAQTSPAFVDGNRLCANYPNPNCQPPNQNPLSLNQAFMNKADYPPSATSAVAVNPVWYGADPTGVADSAPAFNMALSISSNVQFPPGFFRFGSQISYTIPSGKHGLAISCSGQENTVLFWPSSNGILVTYNDPYQNAFTFNDCSLTTGVANVYTGLEILANGTYGGIGAQTNLERLAFRGNTEYAVGNWWQIALLDIGIPNVNARGINIAGVSCLASGVSGNGIQLQSNSFGVPAIFNVLGSNIECLNFGISYGNLWQGVNVIGGNINLVNDAIFVASGSGGSLAQLTVVGVAFNCYVTCISEQSLVTSTSIIGNLFILNEASGALGIQLLVADPGFSNITGNTFAGDATGGASPGANGIVVDQGQLSITGNAFAALASGIILQSDSTQVIAQGNIFSATNPVTFPVTNTGTGNVVVNNLGYNPVGTSSVAYAPSSNATYTAGASPETHYLTGGTVTAVKVPTNAGATICTTTPCFVNLGPNETFSVTYSGAPTDTVSIH